MEFALPGLSIICPVQNHWSFVEYIVSEADQIYWSYTECFSYAKQFMYIILIAECTNYLEVMFLALMKAAYLGTI